MKRLFIAADIDDATRNKLAEFIKALSHCGGKINFTSPQNLHITLAFIGSTEDGDLCKIIHAAADAVCDEKFFPFTVNGVRTVGPADSPKMIWASIADGENRLAELAKKISDALLPLNIKPDRQPFNAHITLARIKYVKKLRELERQISAAASTDFGTTTLSAVTIYESILKPAGPTYLPLHSCRLNGR